MTQPCRPLIEVLAEIPDPRQARGKRYPLVVVLAQACAALLCGYRSYSAIAAWGDNDGAELLQALGFARATAPGAATLSLIFRRLDRAAVDAALGRWAEGVLVGRPARRGALEGVACDGKSLRGSRKQYAPARGREPSVGLDGRPRGRRREDERDRGDPRGPSAPPAGRPCDHG